MKRCLVISIISLFIASYNLAGQHLTDSPPIPAKDSITDIYTPEAITDDSSIALPDSYYPDKFNTDIPDNMENLPNAPDMSDLNRQIVSEIPHLSTFYHSRNFSFYPALASNHSFYSGTDRIGVGSYFRFSDRLTGGIDVYMSSVYFGPYCPTPYLNTSVDGHLDFRLHDNVFLIGLAGYSVRKGLDPNRGVDVGLGNYLGVGVHFKITENLGIGISHTIHRYNGRWHGRTGYYPVGF